MTDIVDADIETAGIAVDLGSDGDAVVLAGVHVENTNTSDIYDSAILGIGSGHDLTVHGTVVAYGMAINLGASVSDSAGNYVRIGVTGFVESNSDAGIAMLGHDSIINVEGDVVGAVNGISWWSAPGDPEGHHSHLFNSGHIEGETSGVYLDTSEAMVVRNSGVISGGDYAVAVVGSGRIRFVNTGLVEGVVAFGSGNDIYRGENGEATTNIQGFAGQDRLFGGDGDEIFFGGEGNDTIRAGEGEDYVGGDGGADILAGGGDADIFLFQALADSGTTKSTRDLILDFSHGEADGIDLSALDAKPKTGDDDAFRFLGTGAFTGKAGEVRYEISGDSTIIHVSTDTDKADEISLELAGKITLVEQDFAL